MPLRSLFLRQYFYRRVFAVEEFFRHYKKYRYPAFAFTYFGFNLAREPFKDRRFRQAMAYAIDKREIIDGVLLGMGRTANGPFPPQSWAYDPSAPDYPYDPAAAKRLLAELGWKDTNNDGWLDKGGRPLEFTIITNQGNKLRALSAEIIQAQLRKLGIRVNVRVIEWSTFIHQFIDKKNFEAIIMGWSLARDPDQYALWHSGQTAEGQFNFISYNNPEVDRLLVEGRRTFDQKKRAEIYHAIHRIMAQDLPCVFLYYPETLAVVHERIHGIELAPAGLSWNFYQWWVPATERKYPIRCSLSRDN